MSEFSENKYIPSEGGKKIGEVYNKEALKSNRIIESNTVLIKDTPPERVYISEDSIEHALDTTIKKDEVNKKILLYCYILNYTDEDQQNIGASGPSSSGKSYLALQIAKFFPEEDVLTLGYTSPKAFFHELGVLSTQKGKPVISRNDFVQQKLKLWDKENPMPKRGEGKEDWRKKRAEMSLTFKGMWNSIPKVYRVNLHQKIIIFMDLPHDELLRNLRSLLSHDQKIVEVKITDKTKSGSHKTKSIELVGYPTVVFNSVKFSTEEQERTRMFLLSPDISQEKLRESIELLGDALGDRTGFQKKLESNPHRQALKKLIRDIKNAKIKQILIREEDSDYIVEKFLDCDERPHLAPRHQRDFPRLIALCKAHALLNFEDRERTEDNNLWATRTDLEEGYNLYTQIAPSNELGIPPQIYTLYIEGIKPQFEQGKNLNRRELASVWYKIFKSRIGNKRIKTIVDLLVEAGLVFEKADFPDRRVKIICDVESKEPILIGEMHEELQKKTWDNLENKKLKFEGDEEEQNENEEDNTGSWW